MYKEGSKVKDVDPHKFVDAFSDYLKRTGRLEVPVWVDLVKTGHGKELGPLNPDWFYVRTASIARHIYINGYTGIGRLAKVYSTSKNRGSRPYKSTHASRSVIRKSLQALEKLNIIKEVPLRGRVITPSGQKDLDRLFVVPRLLAYVMNHSVRV